MNYLQINKHNEEHLTTLITWLFEELSHNDNKYAIWVSKIYSAKDIYEFIISNGLFPKASKHRYDEEYDYYIFSAYQEQLTITNNNSFVDYLTSGIDVKLIY